MPSDKHQSKPPPVIGKIGYYTVFVTPTAKSSPEASSVRDSESQKKKSPSPVQPPPVQYEKSASSYGSKFGFFWEAIATLQNVHSSLDDYLAHWFGLNQSKYQWALDDYYEHESMEKVETGAKDIPPKAQSFVQLYLQEHCLIHPCVRTSQKENLHWFNGFSSTDSPPFPPTPFRIFGIMFGVVFGIILFSVVCSGICKLSRYAKSMENKMDAPSPKNDDSRFIPLAMDQFLEDMEREKPIRFTSKQLIIATDNFSIILGSGGFGKVYKGIISNNKPVAVKVLNGTSNQQIEEQFMAEVSTMGRTHHFNLVRLYGFCFESSLIALVYEFMVNGSLDNHLFQKNKNVPIRFEKLHEIAVGTARGITYLHEDCDQRIVHYDIKPGNVLLDSNFCAKVADFGLAKLCSRDNTHITMTRGRGTPGYAAPELWMPLPVTHKCDVYSFGMLLFEIIGRRKNMNPTLGDSQQWFPTWAWGKYEKNQLTDLMTHCEIEETDHAVAARMLKVAFCCVQYKPDTRPMMSMVLKMLEGVLEVQEPLNPFTHLFSGADEPNDSLARIVWNVDSSDWSSSEVVTRSVEVAETPLMRKYEITMASI
ncbi:hypothetical protein SSX86_026331 [Deinandra increscens subsp. villosa]|uniref:Protein kinase domain-containing protein n=1 Tax=Deinandra increscens subsp. villosa TaxID=3103831 RepID=A0AAP0CE98_9ASTR